MFGFHFELGAAGKFAGGALEGLSALRHMPGVHGRCEQPPPQFEQLGSQGIAKPYIPSPHYLSSAWLEAVKDQVEWAKRHMSAGTSKFLCLDRTFRVAKYVRCADGKQAHKCVMLVYNEKAVVLGQYFNHFNAGGGGCFTQDCCQIQGW